MSAHQPGSDVGRLNRRARGAAVCVDRHTWRVLELARGISAASGGAFDVCVAPLLARWGYLPKWAAPRASKTAGWEAVELLPESRVRFHAPVAIDLGGIAKGYAVDLAAAALRAHGITCFTVNAGGDLRVGDAPQVIHVRHPTSPRRLLPLAEIADAAAATTATYFASRKSNGTTVHPVVVPRTQECAKLPGSITVFARECATADALTKVVAVLGNGSGRVLRRFGASACLIGKSGELIRMGTPARTVAA